MTPFLQISGAVLLAVILVLALKSYCKEIATILAITVCCLTGLTALHYLQPVLESPVLTPAFDNILPALFGGLGVVYISKNWKIAVAPLLFMVALFLFVPSLASSVGVLVPVGALVAIGVSRILYKKGKL